MSTTSPAPTLCRPALVEPLHVKNERRGKGSQEVDGGVGQKVHHQTQEEDGGGGEEVHQQTQEEDDGGGGKEVHQPTQEVDGDGGEEVHQQTQEKGSRHRNGESLNDERIRETMEAHGKSLITTK